MKKVIVIGSNSFSGSDFIDLLLEKGGYKIIGVSRSEEKSALFLPYKRHGTKNFQFFRIDLNYDLKKLEKILDEFRPDYIVNFAAQSEVGPSWKNPDQWFITNAVSITKLADMLKDKKYIKRYVHISSPEVYGTCIGKITEDAPLNPTTPYAASKAAGDLSLFTYYKNFNFPLVMVRATNVYGAHQQLFKIIPRSIISILGKKKIGLHGGGKSVKSYIHIRDVSVGEMLVMEQGRLGEIYHISPDQGISVRNLVEQIVQKMNVSLHESVYETEERLGQDKAYVIDSTKIRQEMGWSPKISLSEGIHSVVEWAQKFYSEISILPLEYIHKP